METKLQDAVLKGIEKAQKAYLKMYGDWVEHASEYWLTTHVAKELWAAFRNGCSVGVEISSDDVRRRDPGRIPGLVKGKRYDIVAFKKNTPFAVVEMKSGWQGNRPELSEDVAKVIAVLKKSDIRFGAVGYYFSSFGGSKKDVEQKIDDFVAAQKVKAKSLVSKHQFSVTSKERKSSLWSDEEEVDWAWVAGCLLIKRS